MIALKQNDCRKTKPILTCDVCYEQITDPDDSAAMWTEESDGVVFLVHRTGCVHYAMRMWGRYTKITSLRYYLSRILESLGYIVSISVVSY